MKNQIGGSDTVTELAAIQPKAHLIQPIEKSEFQTRIDKAIRLMKVRNIEVIYLNAGTNLYYFTGMKWNPSERMVGAILFQNGVIHYIAPAFEKGTILDFMLIKGEVHCWEEHESPFNLFVNILKANNIGNGDIGIDETTPFFIFEGILKTDFKTRLINAKTVIAACRMVKSDAEIAIIKALMEITLEVQKAAAKILRVGISAREVINFIHEAHQKHGIPSGSYFCIVLFGEDSAFPHGVKKPKNLDLNEMVLIDTGCSLHHYISDITRTYVFGEANEQQRKIWNIEKAAQFIAFEAAQLGKTCASVDIAVRKMLVENGLEVNYKLPGLPHRTGHGIGLDIHEYPYIVQSDQTVLTKGMCFSNEPMICVPNKFGIRLEDHVYMTKDGAKWFTEPSKSIDFPFV
jgi:Xaa-Pro dipeptidase